MFTRSQWIIIGIFGLATIGSFGAMVYMHNQSKQVIQLWGAEIGSSYIKGAKIVELLVLEPVAVNDQKPSDFTNKADKQFRITQTVDITTGNGVLNMRNALVQDLSYDWQTELPEKSMQWQYAIRFVEGEQTVVLLLDPTSRCLTLQNDHQKQGRLIPQISEGLVTVFKEQLELNQKKESATK